MGAPRWILGEMKTGEMESCVGPRRTAERAPESQSKKKELLYSLYQESRRDAACARLPPQNQNHLFLYPEFCLLYSKK